MLREDWQRQTTEYDDYDEEDEGYADDDFARSVAEEVAPFSRRQFPGLAQAEDHQPNTGQSERVLSELGAARVGLVSAARPADALPALGWNQALVTAVPLAAVLRSWEDRFGIRVVALSFDQLVLSVAAPPTTQEEAEAVAAEHFAFCPDNITQGHHDALRAYARHEVLDQRVWSFWWD